MARVVTEMPAPGRSGAQGKYPWAEWFDGQIWELSEGDDFQSPAKQFRVQVYSASRRFGANARISMRGTSVFVQAHPAPEGSAAA